MKLNIKTLAAWVLVTSGLVTTAWAGPPFITDDPAPVDFQNWEVYLASMHTQTADGWNGTAPHLEVNYGAVTNLQLHLIAPLSYDAPRGAANHYGYGDTELGFKYRFVEESDHWPQIGIFPLFEVPTGSQSAGLGTGHLHVFLPIWLQKSFGDWTVYGGGGYWINPGTGNRDYQFGGAVVQRQIKKWLLLGAEVYHATASEVGGRSDTAFNIGTVMDISEHQHFMMSAGRSFSGPTDFQVYVAYQFTFGPEIFHSVSRWFGNK